MFHGLVEDQFEAIIAAKLTKLRCSLAKTIVAPDDAAAIAAGVERLTASGADLLITTAGLSVDPGDVTRQGLAQAGVTNMRYGVPLLPGAMTLLAEREGVQVLGAPACVLHFKTTSLDVLLPRLLAGVDITRRDLARLGVGGMCLQCEVCSYPKCPFGK